MAIKEYFCKVSWDKNEIVRSHDNLTVELDLTTYPWINVEQAMKVIGADCYTHPNFTIDFMVETGA